MGGWLLRLLRRLLRWLLTRHIDCRLSRQRVKTRRVELVKAMRPLLRLRLGLGLKLRLPLMLLLLGATHFSCWRRQYGDPRVVIIICEVDQCGQRP